MVAAWFLVAWTSTITGAHGKRACVYNNREKAQAIARINDLDYYPRVKHAVEGCVPPVGKSGHIEFVPNVEAVWVHPDGTESQMKTK